MPHALPATPLQPRGALSITRTRVDGDCATLSLAGELDIATAPQLARALSDPDLVEDCVVLDLRELLFVSSSAAPLLLDLNARLQGRLTVICQPGPVTRFFRLTNLDHALHILTPPAPDPTRNTTARTRQATPHRTRRPMNPTLEVETP